MYSNEIANVLGVICKRNLNRKYVQNTQTYVMPNIEIYFFLQPPGCRCNKAGFTTDEETGSLTERVLLGNSS